MPDEPVLLQTRHDLLVEARAAAARRLAVQQSTIAELEQRVEALRSDVARRSEERAQLVAHIEELNARLDGAGRLRDRVTELERQRDELQELLSGGAE